MKKAILGSLLLFGLFGWCETLPQPAIAQSSSPSQQPAASVAVPGNAPQVKLLNPGTGDRQLLRFKPVVGTRQLSLLSFDQVTSLTMEGAAVNVPAIPQVNATIEAVVTKVDNNGDIHYQFTYPNVEVVKKPGVPSELLNIMQSQMQTLTKMRGNFVISDRGEVRSGQFDLPNDVDPLIRQALNQFSQSMSQLSFPLPTEAVGAGAKWQTTSASSVGGINIIQTGTYELVSLNNNVATLNVQVTQQAPAQTVNPPGLPMPVKIQLKSLQTTGDGQSVLDLTKPFVQRSTLSLRSTSQMSAPNLLTAKELTMTTQSTIQMKFEPK